MEKQSDRELLELAAKAAGHVWQINPYLGILEIEGLCPPDGGSGWITWNPLTDDGDALRLAVKLGISFCRNELYAFADMEKDPYEPELEFAHAEELGKDQCKAARLVIVRAAAEIGRRMQDEQSTAARG